MGGPYNQIALVVSALFIITVAWVHTIPGVLARSYNSNSKPGPGHEHTTHPSETITASAASGVVNTYSWDLHYDYRPHQNNDPSSNSGSTFYTIKDGLSVSKLIGRDRRRHLARGLLDTTYSFVPSNESNSIDALGGLHYTYLQLGTPNMSFLVVMDTGSDLLWVPCDCQQCSPTDWTVYFGSAYKNVAFSVYSPSQSNTSKSVSCDDDVCASSGASECSKNGESECSYVVNYMASNTSTSGVVVQDVLYMSPEVGTTNETNSSTSITTPVYFGCGEVQTGDLVEGVAPNGLLGLGPNDISIPNTLARNGVLPSNSFSICFSSSDTSGRLVFGTQAKEGAQNTSLLSSSIYYVVKAKTMNVGGDSSISVAQQLIFDTGTSYTTLPSSIVQSIGTIFNQKITLSQYNDATDTFDYCWSLSSSSDVASLPSLSITFNGGAVWEIVNPYVYSTNGNKEVVCLGIMSGSSTGIIGYNFMGGYEFFLNQEYMTFSWALSDCYQLNQSTIGTRQASTTIKISSSSSSGGTSSSLSFLMRPSSLLLHLLPPVLHKLSIHIHLVLFMYIFFTLASII